MILVHFGQFSGRANLIILLFNFFARQSHNLVTHHSGSGKWEGVRVSFFFKYYLLRLGPTHKETTIFSCAHFKDQIDRQVTELTMCKLLSLRICFCIKKILEYFLFLKTDLPSQLCRNIPIFHVLAFTQLLFVLVQ